MSYFGGLLVAPRLTNGDTDCLNMPFLPFRKYLPVTKVDAGTPADGKLEPQDRILAS